jgi:hypothetical protein
MLCTNINIRILANLIEVASYVSRDFLMVHRVLELHNLSKKNKRAKETKFFNLYPDRLDNFNSTYVEQFYAQT